MIRILEVKKHIGNLSKNAKNPFFKSAYLDLTDLLNAVEPLLQDQSLVLLQPIRDGKVYTEIIDTESNEVLIDSYISLPNITDPQKLGSAITYFRRYTLKSLLAIAEEDDDGNDSAKAKVSPKISKKQLEQAADRISKGEFDLIDKLKSKFDLTIEEIEILTSKDETNKSNV